MMCLAIILFFLLPLFFTASGDTPLLQWQKPCCCSPCSLCSTQAVFSHRACTNTVVLHHIVTAATGMCLHLSPSERGKRVPSCPSLQGVTCSAPPASPSTPPACCYSNYSSFHLSSWCGEEMGLSRWGVELSWASSRGAVWLSLHPHWSCFEAEHSSVWKYPLSKGTGLCLWPSALEMPCIRFITKTLP